MLWKIDITGANPETEHQIRQHLNQIGVKKGRLQFTMLTPEKIQQALTKRVENITWVGIELNGTALHMKVVEKMNLTKKNILVRGTSSPKRGDHLENVRGKRRAARHRESAR